MRLILDTNALVWWITEPGRLTPKADRAIRSSENELLVSLASLWELAIKISKGGFANVGSSIVYVVDELREQRIGILSVTLDHIYALERLQAIHRDPFDRLIIAQALAERLPVVSSDSLFTSYGVDVLW